MISRLFLAACTALSCISFSIESLEQLPNPFTYREDVVLYPKRGRIYIHDKEASHLTNYPIRLFQFLDKSTFSEAPTYSFDGVTLAFLEAPQTRYYIKHYFHLLEHLVGAWSLYAKDHAAEVKNICILSDGHIPLKDWKGPNQINQILLRALFPNAKVWTSYNLTKAFNDGGIHLEKVFFSDRLASLSTPAFKRTSKMLADALPSLSHDSIESMADTLRAALHVNVSTSDELRVTYVIRRCPPRFMGPKLEKALLEALSQISHVKVEAIDLATISYKEQLDVVARTDVLLGVHGNGLSHLLFLPKKAGVIEIFPADAHALDYHLFSDAKGATYYGIISNRGLFPKNEAYSQGMFGNLSQEVKTLDLNLLKKVIKKELRRQKPDLYFNLFTDED